MILLGEHGYRLLLMVREGDRGCMVWIGQLEPRSADAPTYQGLRRAPGAQFALHKHAVTRGKPGPG